MRVGRIAAWLAADPTDRAEDGMRRLAMIRGIEGLAALAPLSPEQRLVVLASADLDAPSRQKVAGLLDGLGAADDPTAPAANLIDAFPVAAATGRELVGAEPDEPRHAPEVVAVAEPTHAPAPESATTGLDRQAIIELARRLNPDGAIDLDQAMRELKRAVTLALEVIAGGADPDHNPIVKTGLTAAAERVRLGDFDDGAKVIDAQLSTLEKAYRHDRLALLGEGVKIDTLRRDAEAVARRLEAMVALTDPSERPT